MANILEVVSLVYQASCCERDDLSSRKRGASQLCTRRSIATLFLKPLHLLPIATLQKNVPPRKSHKPDESPPLWSCENWLKNRVRRIRITEGQKSLGSNARVVLRKSPSLIPRSIRCSNSSAIPARHLWTASRPAGNIITSRKKRRESFLLFSTVV